MIETFVFIFLSSFILATQVYIYNKINEEWIKFLTLWGGLLNIIFILNELAVLLSYHEQTRAYEVIILMLKAVNNH